MRPVPPTASGVDAQLDARGRAVTSTTWLRLAIFGGFLLLVVSVAIAAWAIATLRRGRTSRTR